MKVVIVDAPNEKQCCCSCKHNIRKNRKNDKKVIYCECEIDGHYIGYVACFECVCDMWEEKECL